MHFLTQKTILISYFYRESLHGYIKNTFTSFYSHLGALRRFTMACSAFKMECVEFIIRLERRKGVPLH